MSRWLNLAEKQEIYAPLAVHVVPTYEHVAWDPDTTAPSTPIPGSEPEETIESEAMIQRAKDHVGGLRPWGADIVSGGP